MPKLWTDTIEAHRLAVREVIMESTWTLVAERGLLSVTMSQIAERSGIGRATLYKYFPDVEAILFARHERHVTDHLRQLVELGDGPGDAEQRLRAVLMAYALISYHRGRHGTEELGALLHRGAVVEGAQKQIVDLFQSLLARGAAAEWLRGDVDPEELAIFCVHALTAAGGLTSEDAVHRLVDVTLAGLRPLP